MLPVGNKCPFIGAFLLSDKIVLVLDTVGLRDTLRQIAMGDKNINTADFIQEAGQQADKTKTTRMGGLILHNATEKNRRRICKHTVLIAVCKYHDNPKYRNP